MVNKLWCEIAIPLLWKNPWHYNINYTNKNYLFNIFFYYSSHKNLLSFSPSFKPLLFDYLSFCKSINIKVINEIASIGSTSYNNQLLQQEFCSLLIKKCSRLEYLNTISISHQTFLFRVPETKALIESLSELICDSFTCSSYFHDLAYNCHNIQRFIIINTTTSVNNGIIKLIEVQKNLKYFEWKDDFEQIDDDIIDLYNEIFSVLEKKADNIDHLVLLFYYQSNKLSKILPKFHKLKTLTLNKYCCLEDAMMPVYNDLEMLNIDHITINAAVNLIANSGGKLKEVLLNYNGYYNDDHYVEIYAKETLELIHKTYKNCPLIEILLLTFPSSTEHFIKFEELLIYCRNLKKLTLVIDDILDVDNYENYERNPESIKKLLQILVRSAPIGLKEIRIYNDSIPYLGSSRILERWGDQNIIVHLGMLKDFYL
ncbi:hypothetical protein RclHR1_24880001 [Rhizophagus clarus]|nr:hypothetical protein RclHR1_24880001 [Rhizophagus clarus]